MEKHTIHMNVVSKRKRDNYNYGKREIVEDQMLVLVILLVHMNKHIYLLKEQTRAGIWQSS